MFGAARRRLVEQLRECVKRNDPRIAIGIEWISDNTAQHADFIHSVSGYCQAVNDWQRGQKPRFADFIDLFRYTFPEITLSDREIRDDTDIPRRVNHALLKGLISDVEIYRCRATIAETPIYAAYLKDANALRARQSRFLLAGTYRDTLGFTIDNDEIEARCFVSGNRMAVVMTQSHLGEATTALTVPGFRVIDTDGLGEYTAEPSEGGARVTLKRHALAVLIAEKLDAAPIGEG